MALHSTRIHAHGLSRVTTGLSGHYCDGCRGTLSGESYRCSPCNFDLCPACLGKSKTTVATRVHAHPLTYTAQLSSSTHYCDVCSSPTPRDSWRCSSCNFDVCMSCFETVQAPKPAVEEAKPAAPSPSDKTEVSRLHAHPLTFTTPLAPNHFCDGCRAPSGTSSWRCSGCNFDLCGVCLNRSKAPKPSAPVDVKASEAKIHPHGLTRATFGGAAATGKFCDGCRATPLHVSMRCAACNFDLCTACYDRVNKQVVSLHPHALTFSTEGLENHHCDGCRGTVGTAGAWRCAGCDFDLCGACIDRVKTPKPTPPSPATSTEEPVMTKAHAHGLTRTTTGLSGHHCDGCRATALTVSYRCNACNFDLCPTCMNRNRMAQTTRMHAHPLSFTRGLSNHYCDDCRKTVTAAWRCADCNFDLCGVCFVRAKSAKPKHVPTPSPSAPSTPAVEAKAEKVAVKNHTHALARTTTSLTGHYCDSCRASPLTEAHRCDECNFDLCGPCLAVNRSEQTSRLHAHPLAWTTGLSAHYCDVCRKSTSEAFRCTGCNYDTCAACFEAAKVPVAPAPTTFWSCTACTYVNTASAAECYICGTRKA